MTGRGQHSRDKCISSSLLHQYNSYFPFKIVFTVMFADIFILGVVSYSVDSAVKALQQVFDLLSSEKFRCFFSRNFLMKRRLTYRAASKQDMNVFFFGFHFWMFNQDKAPTVNISCVTVEVSLSGWWAARGMWCYLWGLTPSV